LTASVMSTEVVEPALRDLVTIVNRDIVTQTFNATFENGNDGWTPNGLWNRANAPTTGNLTKVFHSGYDLERCDTLVGPEVEFSETSSLSFDLAYISENTDAAYDGLDVQISIDGGRTWNTLDVAQGYSAISGSTSCIGAGSPMFSGISPLMTRYDVNLSDYAGATGQIRFRFGSDPLVNPGPAGAWVDNVSTSNVVVSVPDITCQ